jgi:oligoendopeptidase F
MALLSSIPCAAAAAAPSSPAAEDPAFVWDLSLLYPDAAAWRAAKERVAAGVPKIKGYAGRLGESPAVMREALDLIYGVAKELYRVALHASLSSDEDTRNAGEMERDSEASLLASEFARATSFFDPEVLALGETKVRDFIAREPGLAPYAFQLQRVLDRAPHTLGTEAEGVLSATGLMADAPVSVYGVLTNADMPWPVIELSDGTQARLDQAGYTRWRSANNRADREAVFRAFWGKIKDYERTFGASLFSQVKGDWFRASVRKHPSALSAVLSSEQIPEAVYRTLLAETDAALPTLHRYLKLRGRMLGVTDLRYWDIYPPIVALEKEFPYGAGKDLTLAAVQPLGEEYTRLAGECLDGRYTHVYPRQGKRSGAYMNGSAYDVHPYVLLNYNDDYESVSTLAHEWGHGMHSRLTNLNQPWPNADYATFTAEIASTLNEALLLEHMLRVAQSDDERLYYLGNALEGLRQTFFRQAMFADFELAIHETVEKGDALSGQKLTQIYGGILRRYHGHAQGVMTIDDFVTVEWAYIPHFYRAFYVYQYATSIAASQAFAEKIIAGEPGAVGTYLGLLKSGGSGYPYALVKRAGVDLATPAPYRALAARMNRIMDRIEAILAKRGT